MIKRPKHFSIVALLQLSTLLAVAVATAGCQNGKLVNPFSPTLNPDGTPKTKPVSLTQRTTQYTELYVSVERSINDLYEAGKIPDHILTDIINPANLAARQALKDMRAAAKEQNATSWGVFEKGFLGALDGLIAQRRAAEAMTRSTTRPAFSPP